MKNKIIITILLALILLALLVTAAIWRYDDSGDASLILHLKLDGNANDSSGQGNDGTVSEAVPTNDGKFKGAYEFDGIDDYISIPESASIPAGTLNDNCTVSLWFKLNNASISDNPLVTSYTSSIDYARFWIRYVGGYIYARSSIYEDPIQFLETLNSNQWYHLVYAQNGTHQMGYLDGVLKQTLTHTSGADVLGVEVSLGADRDAGDGIPPLDGYLDEVRIYNRSLSASEIRELYNQSMKSNIFTLKGDPTN